MATGCVDGASWWLRKHTATASLSHGRQIVELALLEKVRNCALQLGEITGSRRDTRAYARSRYVDTLITRSSSRSGEIGDLPRVIAIIIFKVLHAQRTAESARERAERDAGALSLSRS